jgi:hypothetical protein
LKGLKGLKGLSRALLHATPDRMTDLDTTHAAMTADTDNDTLRLQYFAQVADTELIVLLERDVVGTDIAPRVFDLADGPVVLAFDAEEKLAEFVGRTAPYVALPGRVVVQTLAGQGIGLAINLDTASQMLLDAGALEWFSRTLQAAPDQTVATAVSFHPPQVPDVLVAALQDKLRGTVATGLLCGVTYSDGRRGHVLALLDAKDAEPLAQGASEALIFSGIDAGALDVVFLQSTDKAVTAMAKVARRLDLSVPTPVAVARVAPGMDPEKPPRLR